MTISNIKIQLLSLEITWLSFNLSDSHINRTKCWIFKNNNTFLNNIIIFPLAVDRVPYSRNVDYNDTTLGQATVAWISDC